MHRDMPNLNVNRKAQRADGPATVMAIGTANPPNCIDQSTYPDYYFRITNSDHMTELKEKFRRMCAKSCIKKRYMHLTEEILQFNPNLGVYKTPSLNARQDILISETPKLGAEAAVKAIEEWGQPLLKITHLIFCSTGGVDTPGADFQLVKLLGLNPSVKRYMFYQQGCFGGGMVLRLAKDLAENNRNARVLVVCSEISVIFFDGPSDTDLGTLLGQAILSDGAAAVIVGADPIVNVENTLLYEIISADQTTIPDSGGSLDGHLREEGFSFNIQKNVPEFVSNDIKKSLDGVFEPFGGVSDWNTLFWIVHPGGRAILDSVEDKLKLGDGKLSASRQVLSEYGNMSSASVLFVLDNMRRRCAKEGLRTTGEGLEWGVLLGFGPGITVETLVLRSMVI